MLLVKIIQAEREVLKTFGKHNTEHVENVNLKIYMSEIIIQ